MMNLIYQAYGRMDVIAQTQFSLVSLFSKINPNEKLNVVIYTDKVTDWEKFLASDKRVQLVEIDAQRIQKMRGAINFVHRVKVEVLLDAKDKFGGTILYLDGDTYFHSDPIPAFSFVSDQTSILHVAENELNKGKDPLSKKLAKFAKKNKFQILNPDGKKVDCGLSPSSVMYNAGAIGMSEKNSKWLPAILDLTDQMHTVYPKHTMEQLAFSVVLASQTEIKTIDKWVGHYWNQKDDFQKSIDQFLNQYPTLQQGIGHYDKFQWPGPPQVKIKKSILKRALDGLANSFRAG
jgi:hypothetical protein